MKAPDGCAWIADDVRDGVLMLKLMRGCGVSDRHVSVLRVMPTPVLLLLLLGELREPVVRIITGCGRERIEVRRESERGVSDGVGDAV